MEAMQMPLLEESSMDADQLKLFELDQGSWACRKPADVCSCETTADVSCEMSRGITTGSSSISISSGSNHTTGGCISAATVGGHTSPEQQEVPAAATSTPQGVDETATVVTDSDGGIASAKHGQGQHEPPLSKERGGELRRRAYNVPNLTLQSSMEHLRDGVRGMEVLPRSPDDDGILIQGPLQEHKLLFFWQWRWCVLDRRGELQVYHSEEAAAAATSAAVGARRPAPIRRYLLSDFRVALNLDMPSVLVCTRVGDGKLATLLRSGPGTAWEELAASKLWLRMFAQAGRSACSEVDTPALTRVGF
jgi:hypothetical protein